MMGLGGVCGWYIWAKRGRKTGIFGHFTLFQTQENRQNFELQDKSQHKMCASFRNQKVSSLNSSSFLLASFQGCLHPFKIIWSIWVSKNLISSTHVLMIQRLRNQGIRSKLLLLLPGWDENNFLGRDQDREIRPTKIQYETRTEKKWMLIFLKRQDCLIFLCPRRDRDKT